MLLCRLRTSPLVGTVLFGVLLVAATPDARAEEPKAELTKEAALETLLPDHAFLTGEVGIGAQLFSQGGAPALTMTLDLSVFQPVWVRLRGRTMSSITYVDSLVGWSLLHGRDFDTESEAVTTTVAETEHYYIHETSVWSTKVVARRDLVLAGGLKHEIVFSNPDKSSTEERSGFFSQMLMVGAQSHYVTSEGSHDYVELYGLYNLETGGKGLQIIWHNSAAFLPSILGYKMFGGMEFALMPASDGTEFYWGIFDIGISFEI